MEQQQGLPATLPPDGAGLTRRLVTHLNFGQAGGAACYEVYDASGSRLPISYQYDTRKEPALRTGFFIAGIDECFKRYADLVAYWPEYMKAQAEAAA
jgi:hypothetical protein